MPPHFEKIAIVGVGLIGGSIGMSLMGRELAKEVIGIDTSMDTIRLAIDTKSIHRGTDDLAQGVSEADLVILATPVGSTGEILRKIIPCLKNGAIVTDVGSTKQDIVNTAERVMPVDKYFVGGHPMAGSEQAGIIGADRYLLENAIYILTPTKHTNVNALNKVQNLVTAMGARVIELDPQEHDLMVAAVSHLPHLVAAALVNTVGNIRQEKEQVMLFAAGGFRDTTRIASSHPVMWRDICLSNKDMILKALGEFRRVLDLFEEEIKICDGPKLEQQFRRACELRRQIPEKVKGYLPLLHEIIVTVPDKPGVIAEIAGVLGDKGININDIEILRVREGEGGTIRLGFSSGINREEALRALRSKGIVAKIKK